MGCVPGIYIILAYWRGGDLVGPISRLSADGTSQAARLIFEAIGLGASSVQRFMPSTESTEINVLTLERKSLANISWCSFKYECPVKH